MTQKHTQRDDEIDASPALQPREMNGRFRSLSSSLLWLTILFVMIAEVLIFVPSVANFRMTWLEQRLNTAAAASILITANEIDTLPRALQDDVLMATGAKAIALRMGDVSKLLVVSEMPPMVDRSVDLTTFTPLGAIVDAFETLIFGGDRTISVVGAIGDSADRIELIMPDDGLHAAMLVYGRNVAAISLVISLITAFLVFMAINRMMIRPIKRMSAAMIAFGENPEAPGSVISPINRNNELGIAENQLAQMQSQLQTTLRSQKRLADLGLAVSKINHDMRNILASAQLMSDRLADTADPAVQRFAPKLIRAIDRAVAYTGDVLSYGKAREHVPQRRRVKLKTILDDVEELLGPALLADTEFSVSMDADMEVDADPEQLFRVLMNLSRNAAQAMQANNEDEATIKRLSISAARMGTTALISVEDTGPGIPAIARENLFSAFKGSVSAGGTGLGLAIAHELVTAHGGTLELRDDRPIGTHFEIRLPDAPISLAEKRKFALLAKKSG